MRNLKLGGCREINFKLREEMRTLKFFGEVGKIETSAGK